MPLPFLTTRSRRGRLNCIDALLYRLSRALDRLTHGSCTLYKYRFVAQSVTPAGATLSRGRGADIVVTLCRSVDDLPPACLRPAGVLAQRYAQGALCMAALRGGRLSGFLWLLGDAYQEDEVRARYRLASRASAWDFDVWVDPEARLGATFARLWDSAHALLRERAVHWSCSRISAFNSASLAAHAAIGTVAMGSATFLRCGRWQWMCATRPPYVHLSRRPLSFPEFVFDTSALARL